VTTLPDSCQTAAPAPAGPSPPACCARQRLQRAASKRRRRKEGRLSPVSSPVIGVSATAASTTRLARMASAFSCLACGIAEGMPSLDIKRQSASRRSFPLSGCGSPAAPRCRSAERYGSPPPGELRSDSAAETAAAAALPAEEARSGNQSPKPSRHVRATSDPIDAQEELLLEAAEAATMMGPPQALLRDGLPTLPRYPVAATRNKNCWSEPPSSAFRVRGVGYVAGGHKSAQTKVESGPHLLSARGCDIFLTGGGGGGGGSPGSAPGIDDRCEKHTLARFWAAQAPTPAPHACPLSVSRQDPERPRGAARPRPHPGRQLSVPVGRHGPVL
jgi:hypothetical protein